MNSQTKPVDRRVIKTKKAIRIAFAKLLSKKDLNDITVSDIASLADINRKTFYNYYSGIYMVIDEIENDIVQTFSSVIGEINFNEEMENPYSIFEKLTAIINTDMDFYSHLFSLNANTKILLKIVTLLKNKTKDAVISQTNIDEPVADHTLTFIFSGMFAVYQSWFNSDRSQSIEEISELISDLCLNGIKAIRR